VPVDAKRLEARLVEAERAPDVSRASIARDVGIDPPKLTKLVKGSHKTCPAVAFRKLCRRLGVSAAFLSGEPSAMPPGAIGDLSERLGGVSPLGHPLANPGEHFLIRGMPEQVQVDLDVVFQILTTASRADDTVSAIGWFFVAHALVDVTRWRRFLTGNPGEPPATAEDSKRFAAAVRELLDSCLNPLIAREEPIGERAQDALTKAWRVLRGADPKQRVQSVVVESTRPLPQQPVPRSRKRAG
jgi:hypothetical protein